MTGLLYGIAFALSFMAIYALTNTEKSQNIRFYLLMFVCISICDAGYLALVTSHTLEEAILANKISYLGSCFLPFFMFLGISGMCEVVVPKSIKIVLLIYSSIVLMCVLTIGHSPLYYQSVSIETIHGATYLIKQYGPAHVLNSIMLYCYTGGTIAVIVYSFFKKKNVSYKNLIYIFLTEVFLMSVYFLERVFHSDFEWMAFSYIVFEALILALLRRIAMYDVTGNVINVQSKNDKHAYIVFDSKKNYTGNNALAEKFFPELVDLKVDSSIDKEKEEYLYDNFIQWINSCQNENSNERIEAEQFILRNGMELKCTLRRLFYGPRSKPIGFLVEVVDDTKQQEYIQLINNYNTQLEKSVKEKTGHILEMQNKMILGMANMVESRDDNTGGHIKRTSEVVRILVDELRTEGLYGETLTPEYCFYIIKAAPMHDLGKIAVSDEILKKPGKYTPEEFEEMKVHAKKGAEIVDTVLKDVEDAQFVEISRNIAHYHHEKWNGEGYPEGLSGKEIPLEARIMALADVYDAIVSKRCYKERIPYDEARIIIRDSLGTHFDPVIGQAFLNCGDKVEAFYLRMEKIYG